VLGGIQVGITALLLDGYSSTRPGSPRSDNQDMMGRAQCGAANVY
jgi:hypothetical protein